MAAKKPAAVAVENVTLTVTGAITATAVVPKGTSFRAALTANGGHKSSQFTFVDEAGKPVSIDRKLSGDLKAVATATAAATAAEATSKIVEAAPKAKAPVKPGVPAAPVAAKAAAPAEVQIKITGTLSGTFKATAGTTLRDAIKASQPESGYNQQSFTDNNGKAVGLDRKLTENMTLTSSRRVSGG